MFVAPNGKVFYAGHQQATRYLTTAGTGGWTFVANRRYAARDYGSAVMYEPGKVLYVGGGDPPTRTAEVINLNATSPAWRYTGAMTYARRQINATLLADGTVLVTGGTSGSGFNNAAGAVHAAELWDPQTEQWTTLASNQIVRIYHSTTILLPDARVLHAGSGGGEDATRSERNAEIFSPPYLFQADGTAAPRPVISSSPGRVSYGQFFTVSTPDVAAISAVTLVRLGSVTHAFDQNQRFNRLVFTRGTGGLRVTTPANANLAPPGHYMLFILNSNGVPSKARIIRLG
jgi:hypothetical protein